MGKKIVALEKNSFFKNAWKKTMENINLKWTQFASFHVILQLAVYSQYIEDFSL